MGRILVTGGSGFIGRHLLKRLKEDHHEVFALSRSAPSAECVRALGAIPITGDLTNRDSLNDIPSCDVIFHLAGTLDHTRGKEHMYAVNVTGTKNIIEAAKKRGIKKMVHLSTLAVIADGTVLTDIDEEYPVPKDNIGVYASSKAEAEKIVLASSNDSFITMAIRAPYVWGPGDNYSLPNLIDSIKKKYFSWIDNGNYLFSTCHVYNLVAGLIAATEEGINREVYYITDKEIVTIKEFLSALIQSQNIELPKKSTSRHLLNLICNIIELPWKLLPLKSDPPTHLRETMVLMGQPFTIRSDKAERELNYRPVISAKEGFSEMSKM